MQDKQQYMEDHRGNLVPVEKIKQIDIIRDELVKSIVEKARLLSDAISEFKATSMGEVAAFVEQSALEYGVCYGGKKGNILLTSFDGKYKVQRSIGEYIVFDERLQVAKKLIDECIREWIGNVDPSINANLIAVINQAFEVDKAGKISTDRILSLRRLDIKDEKWRRAMTAISDSIQITGSKAYIRIYARKDDGSYDQIPLDISSVTCTEK